jgi:hypothetical protein
MGGIDSQGFKLFEELFVKGFYALQRHVEGLGAIVQVPHTRTLHITTRLFHSYSSHKDPHNPVLAFHLTRSS